MNLVDDGTLIKKVLPKSKAIIYLLNIKIYQQRKYEKYHEDLDQLQEKNAEDLKLYIQKKSSDHQQKTKRLKQIKKYENDLKLTEK